MRIIFEIKKSRAKLFLASGKEIFDSLEWEENNSLSRLLLEKIDRILRKNKIKVDKISGFEIISDVPKKWTTYRIAEITLKSLELAKKNIL